MTHTRSAISLLLLLAPLARAADDPGGVVLPGDSRPTAGKLEVARARIAEGKSADALPLLLSLLDSNGDDLVPVGEGRSVSARTLCHALLARMDAASLTRYRARADAQARRLLELGDAVSLQRLVEESFCSGPALVAMDRLGDAAFERGRFEAAEGWWRLLAPLNPPAKNDPDALAYPDPPAETVARVRAKQVLARLFRLGNGAHAALDAYRGLHPKASGTLAGRRGLYVDSLAAVADQPPSRNTLDWPTFGGDASRGRVASAPPRLLDRLGRFCRAGPTWLFGLEQRARLEAPLMAPVRRIPPLDTARALAFHPVLVGRHAVVADARFVTAYDLTTGKAEQWYDAERVTGGFEWQKGLPAPADLRYTLTVAEGALFARLGSQRVRDVSPPPPKPGGVRTWNAGASVLVRLSLTRGADGRVTHVSPSWQVAAIDPGRKEYAVFEGAPVVHEGRAFIAATRFEGGRALTAVHCYPAHAEDSSPPPLWRTEVCETREVADREGLKPRFRHHLLTLAGSRLVYCSHSGAIVALDPHTGKRAWAVRYPRRDDRVPPDEVRLRDLAPPLFADGRVYVAPADSDRLYCLDPYTGAILWERDRLDAVHLVGVGKGRLIFTTWRNPRQGLLQPGGLRGVMADDGRDKGGWSLPDDGGGLLPMGRPILVGDLVLWPTARSRVGVFAVRQEDGLQADNPTLLHDIPSGNLVYANGCLLVADARHLWAFVPPDLLGDEEANAAGEALLRQARASANRGMIEEALARVGDAIEGAIVAKKPDEAERWLRRAAEGASPRERLALLVRTARAWEKAGAKGRAKSAWDEIAAATELADQTVRDEMGLPQRAGWLAGPRTTTASGGRKPPERGALPQGAYAPRSPLELTVSLSLGADERFLPIPDTDHLWTTRPREVTCRGRKTGSVAWKAALAFTPTWGRPLDDLLLLAGEGGLATLDAATGKRLWSFAAPAPRRYVSDAAVCIDEGVAPPLADFHLVGARLVTVQGERHLLCLDARSGAVLWQRPAPGAAFEMPAPRGRYRAIYPVAPDRLLTVASTWHWHLDARSGAILAATPTRPDAACPRAPLRIDDARICHVPDPHRVQLLDLATSKVVWTYALPGRTTRTGEVPIVLDPGGDLVVVEPVNLGARVQRLDRATGKPLVPQPPLLPASTFTPSAWLATAELLVHAAAGQLSAWSLATGKLVWRRQLSGEGTWRVERSGKTILAWLERSTAVRFRFRWLTGSLQWHVGPLPSASAYAITCLDAESGNLIQRLTLDPEALPRERPTAWGNGLSVVPMGGVERLQDAAPGPTVVRDRQGLVVAIGNRVKAFHVTSSRE